MTILLGRGSAAGRGGTAVVVAPGLALVLAFPTIDLHCGGSRRRTPEERAQMAMQIQGVPIAPGATVRYSGVLDRAYEIDIFVGASLAAAVASYQRLLADAGWQDVRVGADGATVTASLGAYRLRGRFETESGTGGGRSGTLVTFYRARGEDDMPRIPAGGNGADAGASVEAVLNGVQAAEQHRQTLPADIPVPTGWHVDDVSMVRDGALLRAWFTAETPPDRSVRDFIDSSRRHGWNSPQTKIDDVLTRGEYLAIHGTDSLTLTFREERRDRGLGTRLFLTIIRGMQLVVPDAGIRPPEALP